MDSKVMAVVMSVALALVLASCGSPAGAESVGNDNAVANKESENARIDSGEAEKSNTPSNAAITEAEAKAIALQHANIAESDVTFLTLKLDRENGRLLYEVEFYSASTEYDYEIDATTGIILEYDTDIENYSPATPHKDSAANNSSATLSEEKAIEIALAKVPGATKANIRIHLDHDDGIVVYEGEIIYKEMEYEFEISATDGTVREWSAESVYDD